MATSKPKKIVTTKGAVENIPSKFAATKSAVEKPPKKTGFTKPLTPSKELSEIVGNKPLPRTEVVKALWDYIKLNNLQDSADKRKINADSKLSPIFGKPQITMFEMAKVIGPHLS